MSYTKIQAVLFNKDNYNKRSINTFLKRHKMIPLKPIHESPRYCRQRLIQPNYKTYVYRFMPLGVGVDAIIQIPK